MGRITFYKGDCLEIMGAALPDKSVDMVLCDLPYGVTQNSGDKPLDLASLWTHYKRIVKPNGCVALFAQGKFYIELVQSNLPMFRYDLIWNKEMPTGFLNAKRMPLRQHEQVAIFYKEPPVYHPQFTEGKPSHDKGRKYLEKEPINRNYGKYRPVEDTRKDSIQKYPTSILRFPKPHPSVAIHPTEKPVALLEWLIKTYTDEGDIVLDNCAGSMSTAIACLNTNRRGIMIEKDDGYFDIGKSRVEKYLSDLAIL